MIAYIKGELVETLPGSVILDVHGIGYRIYISGRESEQLTKMGSQVRLHTYFHVKEDAMQLYGFQHKDDLEVFSLLLGVSGIENGEPFHGISTASAGCPEKEICKKIRGRCRGRLSCNREEE